MGYQLYRHVLDHAPADLTSSERFVLAVIADDANDVTRTGYPGMDVICHRTGMTPGTVQKALWRLAQRGIEVRVALGTDSKGRSVYAVKGKRTTYQIPRLPERDDLPSPMARPQSGHSEERPDSDLAKEGVWPDSDPTMARPESDMARPQSGPSPQVPSESPQGEDAHEDEGPDLFGDDSPKPKKKAPKKATQVPDDFTVTPEMRAYAKEKAPLVDVDFETDKFLLHHGSKGSTFKDWGLAWKKWMRTEQSYAEKRGGPQLRAVAGDAPPQPHTGIRNEWMNRR